MPPAPPSPPGFTQKYPLLGLLRLLPWVGLGLNSSQASFVHSDSRFTRRHFVRCWQACCFLPMCRPERNVVTWEPALPLGRSVQCCRRDYTRTSAALPDALAVLRVNRQNTRRRYRCEGRYTAVWPGHAVVRAASGRARERTSARARRCSVELVHGAIMSPNAEMQ